MNKADNIHIAKTTLGAMKDIIEETEKILNRIGFDECDASCVAANVDTISELCDTVITDMANIYLLSEEKK